MSDRVVTLVLERVLVPGIQLVPGTYMLDKYQQKELQTRYKAGQHYEILEDCEILSTTYISRDVARVVVSPIVEPGPTEEELEIEKELQKLLEEQQAEIEKNNRLMSEALMKEQAEKEKAAREAELKTSAPKKRGRPRKKK